MTLLKKLNINVLPATNIFTNRIDINGLFGAEIFENRDYFYVYIGNLFCFSEADLRWQLKSLYGCDLPMTEAKPKNINTFNNWWQNVVHGNYISNSEFENILDKFNQ